MRVGQPDDEGLRVAGARTPLMPGLDEHFAGQCEQFQIIDSPHLHRHGHGAQRAPLCDTSGQAEVLAAGNHQVAHGSFGAIIAHHPLRGERPQKTVGASLEVGAQGIGEHRSGGGQSRLRRGQVELRIPGLQQQFLARTCQLHSGFARRRLRHAHDLVGDHLTDAQRVPISTTAVTARIQRVTIGARDWNDVALCGIEKQGVVSAECPFDEPLGDARKVGTELHIVPTEGDRMTADAEQHRQIVTVGRVLHRKHADPGIDNIGLAAGPAIEEQIHPTNARTQTTGHGTAQRRQTDIHQCVAQQRAVFRHARRAAPVVRQWPRMRV